MKRMLIAGNWKMNTLPTDGASLATSLKNSLANRKLHAEVLVCPPYTSLSAVADVIKGTDIMLGSQNCYYEEKGAYTGEVSPQMLMFLGCSNIIIGHSERRTIFNETDELINKKALAILKAGLRPIICIGETLEQRKNNQTFSILERQIADDFNGIDNKYIEKIVVAYEPVWAIGTGLAATTEQVQEAHAFIRLQLSNIFGDSASSIIILYGGSLNDQNAESLLELKDVNGGLIGGASLKSESFLSIINTAENILNRGL